MPTTYMNLDLPTVSSTVGPDWATALNAALTIVDSHDHSTVGQKIPTAGLNINSDLDFNSNSLTNFTESTFKNNTSDPGTNNSLYVKSGDLYFRDSASNNVRVTSGGALDLSGTGGITGDYTTTSAVAFYTDSSLTFFFQDSATNPAILSFGTAQVGDGTVSLPAYTFTSDKDTGVYSGGANTLNFATSGTQAVSINSSQETTFAAQLYLPNNTPLNWRNNANSAYLPLTVNTSDALLYNSNPVVTLANGTADYVLKMNTGGTTFEYGQIVNASVATGAAIDAAKIHDGSVSNTEFGYLDGVTSAIQTQLDGKVGTGGNESIAGDKTFTGNVDLDNPLVMAHNSTPSNPSASHNKLYFKSDDKLYYLDSSGTETDVTAGASTATASTQGLVTSYFPTIQSAVHSVSSADYTVLDTDGYEVILMTTGATNRTVTLPTAADNTGRIIKILKVDSGAGLVTVDGEGAETIDGNATAIIPLQTMSATFVCDGTSWYTISKVDTSPWFSYTPTISNFGTTPTSVNFQFRAVGQNVEIQGEFTAAATPAASIGTVSLPNSTTVKFLSGSSNYQVFGDALIDANTNQIFYCIAFDTTSVIRFGRTIPAASTHPLSPINGNSLVAAGDRVALRATIPITQWTP